MSATLQLSRVSQAVRVCTRYVHVPTRKVKPVAKTHRNDAIKHKFVKLVDPESGQLLPSQSLRNIMDSINIKTHAVELVQNEPEPIVKIVDKKEAFEKMKEAKNKAKNTKAISKSVQLTWDTATADLAHKIGKVREILEEGFRVDLVFNPKKGRPAPRRPEMKERLDEVTLQLSDISKVRKPAEYHRAVAYLFLESTAPQKVQTQVEKTGTPTISKYRLRNTRTDSGQVLDLYQD